MYQKIVSKGNLEFSYLKVRLDFEEEDSIPEIDILAFKRILLEATTKLFGLKLSSSLIDVLRFEPSTRTAIIRIHHDNLSRFWSSLTLYGSYKEYCCAFRILQVSPHLMAMANNSRTLQLFQQETS